MLPVLATTGITALIRLSVAERTASAAPPIVTVFSWAFFEKLDPSIVTTVPGGPESGEIDLMLGAALACITQKTWGLTTW